MQWHVCFKIHSCFVNAIFLFEISNKIKPFLDAMNICPPKNHSKYTMHMCACAKVQPNNILNTLHGVHQKKIVKRRFGGQFPDCKMVSQTKFLYDFTKIGWTTKHYSNEIDWFKQNGHACANFFQYWSWLSKSFTVNATSHYIKIDINETTLELLTDTWSCVDFRFHSFVRLVEVWLRWPKLVLSVVSVI